MAVVALFCSLQPTSAAQEYKGLRVLIPRQIQPDRVTLVCGEYGNGLAYGEIRTVSGVYEYSIRFQKSAKSLKLLINAPGYKMITKKYDAAAITSKTTFVPQFVPLPMIPLTVRITDSGGNPIAGREARLTHQLLSMEYFGYVDGRTWGATVATGVTDANGVLKVTVPSLLDDPYFTGKKDYPVGFGLSLPNQSSRGYGWRFVPPNIPIQRAYADPITIKLVYQGKVSGRIEKSFLASHGLHAIGSAAAKREYSGMWVEAQEKLGGSGIRLNENGEFSMPLPSGVYDLNLEVRNRTGEKRIVQVNIRKDVVVKEAEDLVVIAK